MNDHQHNKLMYNENEFHSESSQYIHHPPYNDYINHQRFNSAPPRIYSAPLNSHGNASNSNNTKYNHLYNSFLAGNNTSRNNDFDDNNSSYHSYNSSFSSYRTNHNNSNRNDNAFTSNSSYNSSYNSSFHNNYTNHHHHRQQQQQLHDHDQQQRNYLGRNDSNVQTSRRIVNDRKRSINCRVQALYLYGLRKQLTREDHSMELDNECTFSPKINYKYSTNNDIFPGKYVEAYEQHNLEYQPQRKRHRRRMTLSPLIVNSVANTEPPPAPEPKKRHVRARSVISPSIHIMKSIQRHKRMNSWDDSTVSPSITKIDLSSASPQTSTNIEITKEDIVSIGSRLFDLRNIDHTAHLKENKHMSSDDATPKHKYSSYELMTHKNNSLDDMDVDSEVNDVNDRYAYERQISEVLGVPITISKSPYLKSNQSIETVRQKLKSIQMSSHHS